MGDNLKAASRFVSESISSLDHITTAPQLTQDRILDSLADLQRGAKAMRARAIYRAAQTAVDMLHKGQPNEKVQSELSVVRSLVLQYQSGLDDVLNHQSANSPLIRPTPKAPRVMPEAVIDFPAADVSTHQAVATAAEPIAAAVLKHEPSLLDDLMMPLSTPDDIAEDFGFDETGQMDEPKPQSIENEPRNELSGQVMPLVQFAPEEQQREALRSLSRLHGEMSSVYRNNPAGAISMKAELKNMAARPKMVAFETLMPELTNVVLTTARHLEKTVSISYSAHGAELSSDLADKVRTALSDLSVILITRSLETPDVRRSRGESGAGHVSIMADVKSGLLEMSVECTGKDITAADLDIPSWTRLKNMGAEIALNREDGRLCLGIKGLRSKPAALRKNNAAPELEQAS